MFETLMRLYDCGKGQLTAAMLVNAVIKGYITDNQKTKILKTTK
ncbi:hypothetical protein SAMN05443270_2441 [Lacrimispora sphenoides]|jgi:hypothetical protein|nr:XkdX family protein [Lacrimispora sphenoides]SET98948.1 hypothetical protein SAMN05443270_2441 [Lacrimispora sphenoides]